MSPPRPSLRTSRILILVCVLTFAGADTDGTLDDKTPPLLTEPSGTDRSVKNELLYSSSEAIDAQEILSLEKCSNKKMADPPPRSQSVKFRQKLRHVLDENETKNKPRKLSSIGNSGRSVEQTYFFHKERSIPPGRHEKRLGRSSGTRADSLSRVAARETSGKMSPSGPSGLGSNEITQLADQRPLNAAREINLAHVSFANHNHQSLSARSTEARFHQIDSSHFSSPGRFRSNSGELSFNLPPLFSGPPPPHHPSRFPPPYAAPSVPPLPEFDSSTPTNISAQHGSNIFLQCTIRNLSNQSVSWIRSRDSHIISVDQVTFIADERFHVFHEPDSGSWSLQIKYVQARDDGTYECQVSSEPKISHFVHFTVVTPVVRIPGGPDIHVQLGDTVTLKCVISAALHHPNYVFWYQGERVVADPGFGTVRTDNMHTPSHRTVSEERISSDTTVATLLIPRASAADAGTYTCAPDALPTASITLHVINGEHPAAMQHGTSVTSYQGSRMLVMTVLALLWAVTGRLLAIDQHKKNMKTTIAAARISRGDKTDADTDNCLHHGSVMTRHETRATRKIFVQTHDLCCSDLKEIAGKTTSAMKNDVPHVSEFSCFHESSKVTLHFITYWEKYHLASLKFRNQSYMFLTRLKYSSKDSFRYDQSSINVNRPSTGRGNNLSVNDPW
ncbi:Immunoglobulin V-set domain [Trinorchestia longiramus]|nr:Immunoglobulin V-set domain [Trinorchestia longiramus]